MNVETGAGANGWCLHCEILCERKFGEALVTRDDGDFLAFRTQHLGIVGRLFVPIPGAVRAQDIGKVEPLRCLHAG